MKETTKFLGDLIRYPSTPGREREVIEFIAQAFDPLLDQVELVPIRPDIVDDPDYSSTIPDLEYADRYNMRGVLKGQGDGNSLVINTHADVAPPSEGQESPFTPVLQGGRLLGRGACDAKGQIATLWHALRRLRDDDGALDGDLIVHIVVEEENGGNGTLALVRAGETADAALVMEPTNRRIVTSTRGAVWFRITCRGNPGHVGGGSGSASALKRAVTLMEDVEHYHDGLVRQSAGIPLFEAFDDPMPLTFGRLHSGDWPATVPGEAVLEGVLGFLPNRLKEEVMAEMQEVLQRENQDTSLAADCHLEFTYRHDPHVTPPEAPVVRVMRQVVDSFGDNTRPAALPCSSDTWLYSNQLGLPALLYGPGKLSDAHSNHEAISLAEIKRAGAVLTRFFYLWCASASGATR